ncbi:hypothetical protein [Maricaulis sp. CAU 1757]
MAKGPAKFVHVGLGKCGSTYLQTVLNVDPGYKVLNLLPLVKPLCQATELGDASKLPTVDFNTSPGPSNVVASSEGLSWAFLNEPKKLKHLQHIHAMAARLLVKARLSDTILVLVRNPLDWVRATHEQSIKEGGSEPASEFVVSHLRFIRDVLNLESLREAYGKSFRRVVFLSADEMRTDPDRFWSRFEAQFEVERPAQATIEQVAAAPNAGNVSLGHRLPQLAALNRSMGAVRAAYAELDGLPAHVEQERAGFLPPFTQAWPWVARRLVEHASDDSLTAVSGTLELGDVENFQAFALDDKLRGQIERRFVNVLAEAGDMPADMVEAYRESLRTGTVVAG